MEKSSKETNKNFAKVIFYLSGTLIYALVAVIFLMTFGFRQIVVEGPSMEPTFFDGERLIITNTYNTMPQNGDVIIIGPTGKYNTRIIKRVIAVAGQTLSIDFDKNEVTVDGVLLDEDYIKGKTIRMDTNMNIPSVIPDGYVFVMGDNRMVSVDSRSSEIGLIPVENIIGKVQIRIFPFDKFKIFYL